MFLTTDSVRQYLKNISAALNNLSTHWKDLSQCKSPLMAHHFHMPLFLCGFFQSTYISLSQLISVVWKCNAVQVRNVATWLYLHMASLISFTGRVYKGIYKGRIVAVKRYRTSKSFMKSEVWKFFMDFNVIMVILSAAYFNQSLNVQVN